MTLSIRDRYNSFKDQISMLPLAALSVGLEKALFAIIFPFMDSPCVPNVVFLLKGTAVRQSR